MTEESVLTDIAPHVHCAECHAAIATTRVTFRLEAETGEHVPETIPAEIKAGTQYHVRPAAEGQLTLVQANVPLCDACFSRIEAMERLGTPAPPKLIVPNHRLS